MQVAIRLTREHLVEEIPSECMRIELARPGQVYPKHNMLDAVRVDRRKEARAPKRRRALGEMGTGHETVNAERSQVDELGEVIASWKVEDLPVSILDRGMCGPLVRPPVWVSLHRVLYHGLKSADVTDFSEPEGKREVVEIGCEKGQKPTSIMNFALLDRTHVEIGHLGRDGVRCDP